MTTIVINENTEEGRNLMGVIRTMGKSSDAVVRIFDSFTDIELALDSLPFESISGVPCNQEELIEAVKRSEEDIKAGRVVPHDELKRRITSW